MLSCVFFAWIWVMCLSLSIPPDKRTTTSRIMRTTTKAWVHANDKAHLECTRRSEKRNNSRERKGEIYVCTWRCSSSIDFIAYCSLSVELFEGDFTVGITIELFFEWSVGRSTIERKVFTTKKRMRFYHHHWLHFRWFDDKMYRIPHYYVVDYNYHWMILMKMLLDDSYCYCLEKHFLFTIDASFFLLLTVENWCFTIGIGFLNRWLMHDIRVE